MLLISDKSDGSNLSQVWTDNSIVSLEDLLGRPMLIEISTIGSDQPMFPVMLRFHLPPDQTADAVDFMSDKELQLLDVTVAKRRFGFLGSDFKPVKSHSGSAFLAVWPSDMSTLLQRQVQSD